MGKSSWFYLGALFSHLRYCSSAANLILEPLQKKNPLVLIAIGAIVGGGLEYFASWAMETFGGIVAWSYLNNPFNFDGRTDLFHALVWGTLGMLWVKIGLPLCEKGFSYLDLKSKLSRFVTVALSVFLVLNIIMTICVLVRTDDRASGIPPKMPLSNISTTPIQLKCSKSDFIIWAD